MYVKVFPFSLDLVSFRSCHFYVLLISLRFLYFQKLNMFAFTKKIMLSFWWKVFRNLKCPFLAFQVRLSHRTSPRITQSSFWPSWEEWLSFFWFCCVSFYIIAGKVLSLGLLFNLEFLAQVLISRSFSELRYFFLITVYLRVFPDGPVGKTLSIQYRWRRFNPWLGIHDPTLPHSVANK